MLKVKGLVLAASLALFSSAHTAEGVVRIATDGYYPPYNSLNQNGKLEGYEIDLANEICEEAKLNCKFELQAFSSIIPSIRFNKHDVIMAGLNDNPDRRRVIDFTVPYAIGYFVFLVKSDSPSMAFCKSCQKTIELSQESISTPELTAAILKAFSGKTIGVEENSIPHRFFMEVPELRKNVRLYFGKNLDDIYDQVVAGKIDGALASTSFWQDKFKKVGTDKAVLVGPKLTGGFLGSGVAIALRKQDQELKDKFSNAITKLHQAGRLKALSEKWFGYDVSPQ